MLKGAVIRGKCKDKAIVDFILEIICDRQKNLNRTQSGYFIEIRDISPPTGLILNDLNFL